MNTTQKKRGRPRKQSVPPMPIWDAAREGEEDARLDRQPKSCPHPSLWQGVSTFEPRYAHAYLSVRMAGLSMEQKIRVIQLEQEIDELRKAYTQAVTKLRDELKGLILPPKEKA